VEPAYFLDRYVSIYDATLADWLPFHLWPSQVSTLDTIKANRLVVILKARQLGLTWLVLGFALWQMLFHPAATVLLFSRRDDEAVDLLKTRLRGMYDRLPSWLKVRFFAVDNDHEWQLSNGSRVLAFPTTAGDSYTATLAIVDEADLVPDLDRLMRAAKPTIDGGGQMVLLSRADKTKPLSPFKRIYQGARQGQNEWAPVFLPWHAHPGRNVAWYTAQQQDIFARTGAVDDLHEQYPATDAEALAPRSLDKRLPAEWLKRCYQAREPLSLDQTQRMRPGKAVGMKAIVRAFLAALLIAATGTPICGADPDNVTLARKAGEILRVNCYRCHGRDGANEGGFNYILDRRQLVGHNKVLPGNAIRSKLYRRLTSEDDPMPPEDEKPRPSADDIAFIKKWIDAGAPDFQPANKERAFISPAEVVRHIHADLQRLDPRDRRFTRYFTLTHLANAGLAADEMQSYRHGLSKLVNSLSWGRRVVVPRPIDPERTVYRIDLRDFQWSEKVWEAVLAAYPYGIIPDTSQAKSIAEETGCRLAHVRGDWFVAAASRPPLYHEVLQLPASDRALEKMLRVDVHENIRQERVARAGFNSSGVSRNNRLIERHESGSVVYWKSYDFAANTGRKNLFAHPLRPGEGESTFQHDGGEIIFTLPNGLQGYLLVDAQGQRINKGPVRIVSDPRRPDRAVENGLSCMSCHARGMIEKVDQVRDHVLKNARAFSKTDLATVQALYPPRDKFLALLREDGRRFQEAVKKTGAPWTATEPIAALALRFEAELDLALAAAEAGVRPPELLRALAASPELARQLGPLKVDGGTVQRQVFVDVFQALAAVLKVGAFVESRLSAYAQLLRRRDALMRQGNAEGAIQACTEAGRLDPRNPLAFHKRGGIHHERGAHDRAIADYTVALRLAPQDAVAHNNRGLAYSDGGDQDRAIDDFNAALRLDPDYAVAHYNRGLAFQRKGDADKAIADFGAAIRLDRRYARAYQSRAAAHYGRGEFDQAIADYSQVVRLDPKSAVAYNNRGFAHYDRADHTKAIADFTQAIQLDPKNAVYYHNRGLAHHDKGDYDQAVADFTAALRLRPRFARAFLGRSHAYRQKRDTARADADRNAAIRLDPSLDKE
jgi:tetratricopeptide (TPR) repeat protein